MLYTRRSILRNAGIVSLASSAATLPLHLFAQARRAKPKDTAPCTPFPEKGVRIFFGGSWIFCADPASPTTRMLAIGRDLPAWQKLPHIFPYGVWQANGIDQNKTSLGPNPGGDQVGSPTSCSVTVSNYSVKYMSTMSLFQDTLKKAPFVYLANGSGDIKLRTALPRLRIISVPIPTQIIPAAFEMGATISAEAGVPLAPLQGAYGVINGLPTTHIFDYWGDQATLTFNPPAGSTIGIPVGPTITLNASTDSSSDMHFHTVVQTQDHMDHGPAMFSNLMDIVLSQSVAFDSGDIALVSPTLSSFVPGPNVPNCISDGELEIEPDRSDLASCSGTGIGIGD